MPIVPIILLEWMPLLVLISVRSSSCNPPEKFDCKKNCSPDLDVRNTFPQLCEDYCSNKNAKSQIDMETINYGLLKEVKTLKIMVSIVLALIIMLFVLFMLVFIIKRINMKESLFKFYRRKIRNKDDDFSSKKDNISAKDGEDSGYSISYSPSALQESHPQFSKVREDAFSISPCQVPFKDKKERVRMPSESTCPDESHADDSAYDNLGLSTSTINIHSRPSSPLSPNDITSSDTATNSMATLNTTMTTVHLDSNNGTPNRNCPVRRSTP